ncbi:MAG: complex I subunit 1 family protein [Polyangiaceae bacterium]
MSFSWVELVLALIKIVIVLGFILNMSAIATWADRRQSAMIQHRVGPNRAVIQLPAVIVRGILATPGILIGALAAFGLGRTPTPEAAYERLGISLQLIVLVSWFSFVVLAWRARRAGPLNGFEQAIASVRGRTYFFAGLAAHVLCFAVVPAIPRPAVSTVAHAAAGVLGALMITFGLYAAGRVPPGKIGIRLAGTLHALADTVKMIFKEDFVPPKADKLLHALGPIIAIFPALVVMAVIPFGDAICFRSTTTDGSWAFRDLGNVAATMSRDGSVCEGHFVSLQVADLHVGILYLFAISSTGVIGAAIAGWASDNKFSLLGGLRAASQMVSYEVAMGLSLMGLLLIYGTIRLNPMVGWQNDHAWGIFVQPIGFLMFLAATMAETKRVPFDQPEGESEIVAGYFVEYSGFKWGMFMAGEYIEVITSSALLVTLFFGGYSLPFLYPDGVSVELGSTVLFSFKMNHLAVTLIQVGAFFTKTIGMAFVQIFFRWTLPRFRYDQLMKFGWTKLLPLAIANLVVTAVVVVAIDQAGAGVQKGLGVVASITQLIVAIGMVAFPTYLVMLILRPTRRTQFLQSSAARFAQAAGGVKPTAMQA